MFSVFLNTLSDILLRILPLLGVFSIIMAIYTMEVLIKALKIYIRKNEK